MDEAIDLRAAQISRRHLLKGAGVLGAAAAVAGLAARRARPSATSRRERSARGRGGRRPRRCLLCVQVAADTASGRISTRRAIGSADAAGPRGRSTAGRWPSTAASSSIRGTSSSGASSRRSACISTTCGRRTRRRATSTAAGPARERSGSPRGAGALRRGDPPAGSGCEEGRSVPLGAGGAGREAFDRMTMREWMDANVPGGSTSLLGRSIDVGLDRVLGDRPRGHRRRSRCSTTYITPYPGGPADERYHVRGGNDQVPNMLADLLPADALHLESPLESIVERATARSSSCSAASRRR